MYPYFFFPHVFPQVLFSHYHVIILSHAFCWPQSISSDIGNASQTLDQLDVITNSYQQDAIPCADVTKQDLDAFVQIKLELAQLHQKWQTIFMWLDGPLVQAMKSGELFLADEISLADDSVLERLNSVLEPERKLVGDLVRKLV